MKVSAVSKSDFSCAKFLCCQQLSIAFSFPRSGEDEFWTGLWNPDGRQCDGDSCHKKLFWEHDGSKFKSTSLVSELEAKSDEHCLVLKKSDDEVTAKKCDADTFPAICEC